MNFSSEIMRPGDECLHCMLTPMKTISERKASREGGGGET